MTPGYVKIGWAQETADPSQEIGLDGCSFAFDGLCVGVFNNITDRVLKYKIFGKYFN